MVNKNSIKSQAIPEKYNAPLDLYLNRHVHVSVSEREQQFTHSENMHTYTRGLN